MTSSIECSSWHPPAVMQLRDYLDERKRTEELLRKANEQVEMILYSITDRFFAFDKEWRVTRFKHAEEQLRMIGKDPANFIGTVSRREGYLAQGQRLSQTGSWAWNASTGDLFWPRNIFGFAGSILGQESCLTQMICDGFTNMTRSFARQSLDKAIRGRTDCLDRA